jgi:hypothetical protein
MGYLLLFVALSDHVNRCVPPYGEDVIKKEGSLFILKKSTGNRFTS